MNTVKSFLLIVLLLTGFSYQNNSDLSAPGSSSVYTLGVDTLDTEGKVLLEKNCYACHSPSMANQLRLAPPIQMVIMHYKSDHPEKDDFVNAVVNWVGKPDSSISKMPHALERFGLMPKMIFPEEEVTVIAEYLFAADIKPMGNMGNGMKGMMNREQGNRAGQNNKGPDAFVYPQILQEGQGFVNKAQAALGSELIKAIDRSGTSGAVTFCSTKAIALTDSIAAALDVFIKRVTDQPRNPGNRAAPSEMAYIKQIKNNIKAGRDINPVVFVNNDSWRGYYPIITNNLCLQCHGSRSSDISSETLKALNERYPDDEATGYSESELRGIWVIDF